MTASVIIPTYNRLTLLGACLKALNRQQFHQDWEVIVVNDGGNPEGLEKLIEGFRKDVAIQLLHQQNGGPAMARNFGVQQSKGKFLAFLDDDCAPAPNWLHHLFVHCKKERMTGGYTQNLLQHNVYAEASQQLISYLYEAFHGTPWYFFTTNNLMICRDDFMDLGGFDVRFRRAAGEDRAFCLEWITSDRTMKYVEEAIINHQHHLNFRSFWWQHYQYGRAAKGYQKILRGKNLRLRPSLKFYVGLLTHPLKSRADLRRKLGLFMLSIVSQIATFLGYLSKRSS